MITTSIEMIRMRVLGRTVSILTAMVRSPCSPRVLARAPTVPRQILVADRDRFVLERGGERVVPPVEKTEQRDHADDLDDLLLAPVLAQLGEHVVGDLVRHRRRSNSKVERRALGCAEQRARLVVPDRSKLLVLDAEMQGTARRMRHAVLAAG